MRKKPKQKTPFLLKQESTSVSRSKIIVSYLGSSCWPNLIWALCLNWETMDEMIPQNSNYQPSPWSYQSLYQKKGLWILPSVYFTWNTENIMVNLFSSKIKLLCFMWREVIFTSVGDCQYEIELAPPIIWKI